MPNATVRANARTTPKSPPGSVASIRRKTAELKSSTAALMAAKAVERELEDPNVAEAVALWRDFVRTHSRAEIEAAQAELERKFPRKSDPATIERLAAELDDPNSLMKNEQPAGSDTKHDLFGRAYVNWLHARAELDDPHVGSDEEVAARQAACDEAARSLLVTPAITDEDLWRKWEVLELFVSQDVLLGEATDNRTVMALGCVKADLLRLGIGEGRAA